MKQKYIALILALVLLLGCSGCGLFEKEYTYSEPYVGSLPQNSGDATEVRNYSMLKAAILAMINGHQANGELRFSNYNGSVSDDLAAVCLEVKTGNPLGAYAVESISYDTSRVISYYIAEVNISYKKTANEIRSIRSVNSEAELKSYLHDAVLTAMLPTAAVRPYVPEMDSATVKKLIEEICFENPVGIPLPVTAEVAAYPQEGSSNIFEISLNYPLSPEDSAAMTEQLQARIRELTADALPEETAACALALAEALNAALTAESADHADTAYGALVEHYADSRGIALAYRALCAAADVPCIVVKGSVGAMGTQEHYWNIIGLGDDYYHADVSQFAFDPHYAFLISDDDLWGTYIWDTEAYPACSGALRYEDLLPQPTDESGNAVSDAAAVGGEDLERVPEQETEIKNEESKNIA